MKTKENQQKRTIKSKNKKMVETRKELLYVDQDLISNPSSYKCFVAMPFKPDDEATKILISGIAPTCELLKSTGIEVTFYRADYNLQALVLWDNIRKKIEDCDFLIADITEGNPNVLYELGYARALGKKAIHITRTKDLHLADLQGWYFIEYSIDNLQTLSHHLARYISDVVKIVDAQVQNEIFKVDGFRSRSTVNISQLINDSKHDIDIYTTNVGDFLNYQDTLVHSLQHQHNLKVRVLTMDPESDLVSRRARQLNIDTYTYRKELRKNLREFYLFGVKFPGRVSFRIFDDLPTQITFRFDDKIVTSVVSTVTRSRSNIHFKLSTKQIGVTESFIYHFEVIWGRSLTYAPQQE